MMLLSLLTLSCLIEKKLTYLAIFHDEIVMTMGLSLMLSPARVFDGAWKLFEIKVETEMATHNM